ncbi:MAG: hypothetical protein RMK51_07635 [Meiothermus sp.]|uniref:TapB family protein n=1 Tax=Meiothermus sp. TaxID=1955249 RepID=UPI00298F33C9|nr:hypothetical protein [Meiothermus sp.]MDW8425789.1 hypothetical protein [Meiothermus sp.]
MKAWGFWAVVWLGSLAFGNVCSSAFYPTDPDLRWRYRNLNDNQVYTQTFSPAGVGALLEQRRFATRTETTQWTCTPQGLRTLPEGELPIPGGSVRLTKLTGVVIPSNETWRVGGRWTYRYELRGRIALFDLTGFLEVENRIVARETISVPAGRFETLRVEASFRGEFGIGFGGRATYWFAEGVGVVKQVSEGTFGGQSSELLEFGR